MKISSDYFLNVSACDCEIESAMMNACLTDCFPTNKIVSYFEFAIDSLSQSDLCHLSEPNGATCRCHVSLCDDVLLSIVFVVQRSLFHSRCSFPI
jgi:hypothetical protein